MENFILLNFVLGRGKKQTLAEIVEMQVSAVIILTRNTS